MRQRGGVNVSFGDMGDGRSRDDETSTPPLCLIPPVIRVGDLRGIMTESLANRERNYMRFVSWNVNGLRAVLKKGFEDIVCELDADIVALQETKLQEGQATLDLPQYREYWSYAEKKGYSGTAISVSYTHLALQALSSGSRRRRAWLPRGRG